MGVLGFGDLTVDPASGRATRAGVELKLGKIPFQILTLLVKRAPQLVTRQEVLDTVWGDEEPDSDALRSHIYALRSAPRQALPHPHAGDPARPGLPAGDPMTNPTPPLASGLPSLRRRLVLALGGAGLLLLVILSLLMVVAENKMEELSLRHWLEAEATRYDDDWLRLGMAAPAPSPRQFSSYWTEAGRLPAWLKAYQSPGFFEHQLGGEDKHFLVRAHPLGSGAALSGVQRRCGRLPGPLRSQTASGDPPHRPGPAAGEPRLRHLAGASHHQAAGAAAPAGRPPDPGSGDFVPDAPGRSCEER